MKKPTGEGVWAERATPVEGNPNAWMTLPSFRELREGNARTAEIFYAQRPQRRARHAERRRRKLAAQRIKAMGGRPFADVAKAVKPAGVTPRPRHAAR